MVAAEGVDTEEKYVGVLFHWVILSYVDNLCIYLAPKFFRIAFM